MCIRDRDWSGWVNFDYDNDELGKVVQDSTRSYDGSYSAHKIEDNDPNGGYKSIGKTLGRDIILEAWVNRNSGYAGGPWDRIGVIDNNGNGYGSGHAPASTSNNFQIDVRSSYAATYTRWSGTNAGGDVWYKHKLIVKSNGEITAEFYDIDGNLLSSNTITNTSYSHFTRVYIFGGYDYWVDQMRIRKYASPEPTYSIGEEENYPSKMESLKVVIKDPVNFSLYPVNYSQELKNYYKSREIVIITGSVERMKSIINESVQTLLNQTYEEIKSRIGHNFFLDIRIEEEGLSFWKGEAVTDVKRLEERKIFYYDEDFNRSLAVVKIGIW